MLWSKYTPSSLPEGLPATAEVGVPWNANMVILPADLPTDNQSGRWFRILILDPIVKSTIISIVINRFMSEHENNIREVMHRGAT